MFVTRATRHDKADLTDFYDSTEFRGENVDEGTAFIARDGGIVGALRVVDVEPRTIVIDGVLVKDDRRNEGVGRRLMQAAMNSRGGTAYVCCHEERVRFYSHFGFAPISIDEAPEPVRRYWEQHGDHPTEEGHEHFFLKAR